MSTSKSGSSQAEIDLAVFLDDKPPATKSGVDDFCIEFMLYDRCVFHDPAGIEFAGVPAGCGPTFDTNVPRPR
jgi:hypothetical protein